MLLDLDNLENQFAHYRKTETKIRLLTYERLWRARTEGMDPLDKPKRMKGQNEEALLLDELQQLDRESNQDSSDFFEKLQGLKAYENQFGGCCPNKESAECYQTAFLPIRENIEDGLKLYNSIFEHEREYRKAVDLTVGGRQGLYPEDTLESSVQHTPFFKRFEIERRQSRFEEDSNMLRFFHDLRKYLTRDFPGDLCCLHCGKGDWNHKVDVLFADEKQ